MQRCKPAQRRQGQGQGQHVIDYPQKDTFESEGRKLLVTMPEEQVDT